METTFKHSQNPVYGRHIYRKQRSPATQGASGKIKQRGKDLCAAKARNKEINKAGGQYASDKIKIIKQQFEDEFKPQNNKPLHEGSEQTKGDRALYFNKTIDDFNLFPNSGTLIVSNVAFVVLLNQPQKSTFLVETDCTTFQQ